MKRWFQARSAREQWLIGGFAIFAAIVWVSESADRWRERFAERERLHQALATQQLWLDRSTDIAARAKAATAQLDSARTYDATRLVGVANKLTSQHGLTASIESPKTEQAAQFAYHSVRLSIRRATLPALLAFYDDVVQLAPYISLEAASIQTDRAAPGQLSANFQLSAPQALGR